VEITVSVDPDLERNLLVHVDVKEAAMEAANKIAERARSLAPVVTGQYAAGIVTQETPHGARVLASDQKSHWVEFGIPSHGQAAQFVLRRAVELAGFKFHKGRG